MIVADESALKHMLECKGAGGKLPCLFCRNCIQKRYAPNPLHPDTVLHTCTDTSKFIRHTDATVYQLVDQLAARKPHCNKGEFETLQTNLGFNHCPEGALLCQPLRRWLRPITANSGHYRSVLVASTETELIAERGSGRFQAYHTDDGVSAVAVDSLDAFDKDVYLLWFLKATA